MNIGIFTYHFAYNFGANLQALSSIKYLQKAGYNPVIINWQPKSLIERYNRNFANSQNQAKEHHDFLLKFIPVTELCRNDDDVRAVIQKHNIEGVIIGSDAMLRLKLKSTYTVKDYIKLLLGKDVTTEDVTFPNPYWLSFINKDHPKGRLKFGYLSASSMGTPFHRIDNKTAGQIKEKLKLFDFISVRDSWTFDSIKKIGGPDLKLRLSPDPVFGFNNNVPIMYTKQQILEKYQLPEKYILLCFRKNSVPAQWLLDFEKEAEKHSFAAVEFPLPSGTMNNGLKHIVKLPLSPIDWYYLIKYSNGYVGENMHPVVIAIHNNVPFYSFDHYVVEKDAQSTNSMSKIYDLLDKTGFTQNWINHHIGTTPAITPTEILAKISNFDIVRCQEISALYSSNYQTLMEDLLTSFNA